MNVADLAAMGERHPRKQVKDPPTDRCDECRRPWPCDSGRLLDEVERLRTLYKPQYHSSPSRTEVKQQTANEPST